MRRWNVRMTFDGYANGATTHDAIADFKSMLGLAPEAMRSEIHMIDLRVQPATGSEDTLPVIEDAPQ